MTNPTPQGVTLREALETAAIYTGWMTQADAKIINDALKSLRASHPPAPEQASVEHPVTLRDALQKRCYEWGTYWRSSDAHGVKLNTEQALELLRDALGVEVEIAATPTAEPAVEAVPKGWKLVPVEPSSDMLDRAVAFALMSVLTGDYKWSQYMTDLWGRFLSAVPAAPEAAKPDNWQQYAQDGENAQQCIERHRKEQDALLTLLANARRPYSDNEEMKL